MDSRVFLVFHHLSVRPVTAEKITIVGSDYESTLAELIDADSIPTEMGGSAEVKWCYPYAEGSGCSPSEIREYLESQSQDTDTGSSTAGAGGDAKKEDDAAGLKEDTVKA